METVTKNKNGSTCACCGKNNHTEISGVELKTCYKYQTKTQIAKFCKQDNTETTLLKLKNTNVKNNTNNKSSLVPGCTKR